jgi:glycosyltransferase involved in cell wall biosynthesis
LVVRAVKSVLGQTYGELEIVVIVDGPDEATHEALRGIADERLRVIGLAKSVGGSDARNTGVREARGEWIAFLDDDDEWLPTKIEKQMALAAKASEPYPVIAAQMVAKSPYGEFIWPRRFPGAGEPVCEYLFNRRTFFAGEGQLQTSMLLMRKALMEQVPFTSGLPKHQDIDWYVRVAQFAGAKFYFVPEPLVNLYVEENRQSISSRTDWRYSMNWVKESQSRGRMTRRAYAGFICTIVATEACRQGEWGAVPELLREIFRNGKPGFMDLSLFAGRWLIRPAWRGKLRNLRHGVAVKQPA